MYPTEKGNEAERQGKNLNEKLASVLLDCHVKEEVKQGDFQLSFSSFLGFLNVSF